MKPKLLYINYSLAVGGIEKMIEEFSARLISQYDIYVAVFEPNGSLEPVIESIGVKVIHLNKKPGVDIFLIREIMKVIKRYKIEIVHTNNFNAWSYGAIAAKLCRGIKVVHTEHSLVRGAKSRRYLLERLLVKMTDHVVAVSEDVKKLMVDKVGMSEDRVKVIANGINVNKFDRIDSVRQKMRESFDLVEQIVVFGAVGRLTEVKDHETLIKSFGAFVQTVIKEDRDKYRLLIAGDGPLKERLQQVIDDLDLNENVLLLGERRDVRDLLNCFDVFCMSSLSEGMSISLLEAMSTGLPIIATAVGGNVELIKDDHNGLLVEAKNQSSFVDAMSKMTLSDSRCGYGLNAREFVVSQFSDENMFQSYIDCYSS